MVMIRGIVTIIWWLCWASLETSTSWKSFGSILVSSDNNTDSKSSIQPYGLVNKSHVVTSGEFFFFFFKFKAILIFFTPVCKWNVCFSYDRAKMGFKRNGNIIATKDKHSHHRAVRRHSISSLPRITEGRPRRKFLNFS